MLHRRFTFANVVSMIALFVALTGGAYAVSAAKRNSVVSKSIRNGQVKNQDLATDAVTGANVTESTLAQVPSAATADHAASAVSADSATNAIHATTADTAANANHATNADHATSAD